MFTTEKNPLTLEDLRTVPIVVPPGAGKIWQGVQHGQLADRLIDHAKAAGINADRRGSQFWTTKDGGDVAGLVPVELEGLKSGAAAAVLKRDLLPCLGYVASNRREMVLTVFCGALDRGTGARVIPSSMKKARDKRWMFTTAFDFEYVAASTWDWWWEELGEVVDTFERLHTAPVSPGRLTNLLVAVGRRELLPWSRVGTADRAFANNGRHPDVKNHYDFLAACAAPLSLSSPIDQLVNGHRLTDYLNRTVSKKSRA